jgi:hypothetical protein
MPDYKIARTGLKTREIDVLVLGGGMAGCFAAMAARRDGASVVLVEPTNALGGQGTAGGVAGFCGDSERVNDLFAELVARLRNSGRIDPYDPNDDRRAYDLEICAFYLQEMVAEKGVEVWLHARAIDAQATNGHVDKVLVSCGATLVDVRPRVVIDATGNATIPDMIGLETLHLGARKQLPMSLYFTLWDTHKPVVPFLPDSCPRFVDDEDLPMTSLHCFADGRVEVKMKVVGFDAADGFSLSQAEIHARRQMMGLVYYLQTRGYRGRHGAFGGKPLSTHVLASVSRNIGQREGRRIVGRYTITDDDARTSLLRDDAIAVGTYHLDYHWTDTEKRAGTGITDMVEPYHIPLAALIPAGSDNILCPGRSVSGEQLAMSSYRVMATCAQTGFGAGIAAALAAQGGRNLAEIDTAALRERIVAGQQSLDLADYGDYLRCLRFSDETLPLPVQSVPQGANAPRRDLALAQTRDGNFVVARLTTPTRIELALRRRTKWKIWAALTSDTPLAAVRLGADLRIAAQTIDGAWGMLDAALPPRDAQAATPIAAKFAPGEMAQAAAPEFPDAVALAGFQRLTSAHCTLNDGEAIRLAFVDGGLVALARQRGALLLARISDRADLSSDPACFATSVGMAIVHRREDGTTHFWEGPIERFAAPQAPQPTAADLKGRPYKDHLILAAS